MPAAVRLMGHLDVTALEASLSEIVRRHEVLRTSFTTTDGEPVQVIHEAQAVCLPLVSLCELRADEREREMLRLAEAEAERGFDLGEWPLMRATLVCLSQ